MYVKPSIRPMLKPALSVLPLIVAAALLLVGLGCGSDDAGPPGGAKQTSTFGASGQITLGANAGKAFVLSFKQVSSDGVPVLTGTLEILGSPVPLTGSIDPQTHDWKMTGTDPSTGIKYTVDCPVNPAGLPTQGSITDSTGGNTVVDPYPQ